MAQQLPIKFQEVLQLPAVGVSAAAINFTNVTCESEKYVCVREGEGQSANVIIVDQAQPNNVIRRPMSADSAMMNPEEPILALKAGASLQVFHVAQKRKIKQTQTTEPVLFWKWISASKLVLVTQSSVLHWALDDASEPQKVFDRHGDLAACQIINYQADVDGEWLCLVGISQKEGRIAGTMQLYSTEKKVSQVIEGHTCSFAKFKCPGASEPSTMFSFAVRTASAGKVFILEVKKGSGSAFQKQAVELAFPADAAGDFPVGMRISEKYGTIFVITKMGYAHLYDLPSGTVIYRNRISVDPIFLTAKHIARDGILAINRKGQILLVTVNDDTIVQYIVNTVQNVGVAIALAKRANLPGADNLFLQQFQRLFQAGQYKEAAKVAAESPGTSLRNQNTIQLFQRLPAQPGQPSPLLQYFGTLLESGKLNEQESIELVRPVLAQGKKQLVEQWLKEDKLECSEELGDIVKPLDTTLALSVYFRAKAHAKVVLCFAETGQYDKIVAYATKVGYTPEYAKILNQVIQANPAAAASFAKMLLTNEAGALADPNQVMDAFMSRKLVKELTEVMLEYLKSNRADQGPLQTRLLEINLQFAPQVADAILGNEMFTHYNRQRVAELAEKAGLSQRALEHYTDAKDVRRVLTAAAGKGDVNPEFLANYFGTLSVDDTLEILKDMLRLNMRGNLQTVVQIAAKYSEQITPAELIKMFEQFKCYDGIFYYLGQVVNDSEDPLVHYKYLEAAARTRNFKEVERIARDSNHYEPARVKEFLMQAKLPDQLPLIIVCDRFDMVEDLTKFLYKNNMSRYIEAYVQQINPGNAAQVMGALLDSNCPDDYIKKLVMSIRGLCPVEALVEETAKRNRLKLLLPWLEARVAEGNEEAATHNAVAKCYIDLNKAPEEFLKTNLFYDSVAVGKYAEKRDPYLAFVAYKRGKCDAEVIDVTTAHNLFKHQARYLVERQDEELWEKVLSEENEHRRAVIDQVVQTALPETKNPEEVSNTVKAFMAADLPNELIELLEKIVLDSGADSEFAGNRNLQNLLVLTAIKADKSRVMDYINRLDNYDNANIASIAVGAELYEEAFVVYKKADMHLEAIEVLLTHIDDLERGAEYAAKVGDAKVWSALGKAQMEKGLVEQSIGAFINAEDPDYFREVIIAASDAQCYEALIDYLLMARPKVNEAHVDTELCYAYAKTEQVAKLEEFVTSPNIARIEEVGDRLFDEQLYKSAKLLYATIDNNARLASCLLMLKDYQGAADAAKKAGSVKTWKEVCIACVKAEEYKIAQMCGLNVITHGDELEDLLYNYEQRGAFDHAIELMEKGVATLGDKVHKGMYTELAILYSKYKEEKMMECLRASYSKMHIQKVIRACEQNLQFAELVFLYVNADEYDNAALTMMEKPARAFDHTRFKEVLAKVNNHDLYYKAIQFYIMTHPTLVVDLLKAVTPLVDHSRVVALARKLSHLPLIKPYLQAVQEANVTAVNEALNELLIEEEDFAELRKSLDHFSAYDNLALAKKLEAHSLMEMRRIAAYLYAKNKRYEESIELSKKDKLYKDAMRAAADSADEALAEKLLRFFVEIESPECFAACLFTCYDLIRPDVALEVAWRNKIVDYAFPYLIQFVREYQEKVDKLMHHCFPPKKEADEEEPDSFQTQEPFALGQTLAIGYHDIGGMIPQPGLMHGMGMPGMGMPQQPNQGGW